MFPRKYLLTLAVVASTVCAGTTVAQGYAGGAPFVDEAATMEDRLGTALPTDPVFRDSKGVERRLGDLLAASDRPVIVNLGYFGCPGICSTVLNTLVRAVEGADLLPGREIDVWTISIDPREGAEMARGKKQSYLDVLARDDASIADTASAGWHFLTSREDGVASEFAHALGWRYRWNPTTSVYDHPPTIVLVSPNGIVTRYLDIEAIEPVTLRRAVIEASDGKVGTFFERIYVSCLTWDPESQAYGLAMFMMQAGGLVTLVALAGMIWFLLSDHRRKEKTVPAPAAA